MASAKFGKTLRFENFSRTEIYKIGGIFKPIFHLHCSAARPRAKICVLIVGARSTIQITVWMEYNFFFISKNLKLYLDRESQPWKPLKKLTAPLENPFKLIFAFN